jgi:hypothetical protein
MLVDQHAADQREQARGQGGPRECRQAYDQQHGAGGQEHEDAQDGHVISPSQVADSLYELGILAAEYAFDLIDRLGDLILVHRQPFQFELQAVTGS